MPSLEAEKPFESSSERHTPKQWLSSNDHCPQVAAASISWPQKNPSRLPSQTLSPPLHPPHPQAPSLSL
uniref:Uncharacterized protein n=1 Tax=Salix viminalis TaxID=40686 RepID=A0A6N2NCG1_SALVM